MPLQLYNSLTRRKELFEPLIPGYVRMYVCGPTVYSHSHVGHAKSYVSFDVLVRYFRFIGNKVLYVQNITDVGHLLDDGEDRMLKQSRLEHQHPMQIAEAIARSYFEDMDALGLVRPDISPRATGHVLEQIAIVQSLLEKEFAYEVNGSVYFDVRTFKEYGRLSGRTLEEAVGGTRVESRSEKRYPEDFALWKRAEPEHIMRWPSPWGEGFPGWHVECSAMSMKYLGETFDIHGGGLDNQFPHHECEIAQSVCATGKPFARFWLHNNLVTVNGQKMSKSLGNFVTLKDLFTKYDPIVVRFFILQSHYRSTLDFSEQALDGARSGFERLQNAVQNLRAALARAEQEGRKGGSHCDAVAYDRQIRDALDDDLNAPQAIGALFELSKEMNALLASGSSVSLESLRSVDNVYRKYGQDVLGIVPEVPGSSRSENLENKLMDLLTTMRNEARKQKNFQISDRIRDGLKELGVTLEDRKEGTVWKKE
ncbi:MAG: cysteine--tRNA ligase [Ignavibacteria bacterium GWA2_55_11]|nr:MAG: cysteine--tRNA ligase [Ignavibacteria bacterium GWA2_55_11]OGU47346.1 MAG: cysteine--tRNA ligase [Ignavibacteria bacterium GWC2_56_12]OGU74014.1 MAG: cysteine--tRNA ligase [Ignavibacteria bacterium RIFCSPLOWO2_02_FULL_55_14]OGU75531.1 MAG: cysteine--tRNA ligase [Ignavibacteria bacterium RIFCSPLOWO2_12_FULL_56_21]HAV22475.1 cysteine--tRNA ligase [Bacteroidota bacterium]